MNTNKDTPCLDYMLTDENSCRSQEKQKITEKLLRQSGNLL